MKSATIFATQAALALVIAGLGVAVISGPEVVLRAFESVGLGAAPRLFVGTIEVAAGLCLLIPRSAMVGVAVLMAVSVGASVVIIADGVTPRSLQATHQASMPRIERAFIGGCEADGPRGIEPPFRRSI